MGLANLGTRRSRGYYYFWSGVFVLFIGLLVGLIYWSTQVVEYNWRWFMVPKYFYYQEEIEIAAEFLGEVRKVDEQGGALEIVVRGEGGEQEAYTLPGDAKAKVSKGFSVYPGDVLASYHRWKPGILLDGLWMTLKVSMVGIAIGIFLGLVTGLARISDNPAFKWSAMCYIEIVRGSPLLVQIFIWYYVLGTLINSLLAQGNMPQVPPFWFGAVSLAVFAGAYIAEIVRAGIQSIHRGQIEAARSLGLNGSDTMRHIILPQALRRILPPLAGQFISLIKDSSLLGIIAIRELTKATREAVAGSLQSFELWIVCAALYLVLTFSLSMLLQYVEKRTVMS